MAFLRAASTILRWSPLPNSTPILEDFRDWIELEISFDRFNSVRTIVLNAIVRDWAYSSIRLSTRLITEWFSVQIRVRPLFINISAKFLSIVYHILKRLDP
jgi:hypothetical protein